jgi:hypothetical protein
VNARLKQVLSWWFILQILLPFTAPLQTLDVHDLFGARSHRSTKAAPESTTTPTINDGASTTAAGSLLAPATPGAYAAVIVTRDPAVDPLRTSAFNLQPSPRFQRSVLRL